MQPYESHYASLQFERGGLFEAIQKTYHSRDVLYPGCSVHITPSLYFPHVVYVDQSEAAARFFADQDSVMEFVRRHKHYKQSAYLGFLQQDYSRPLGLQEGSFDLLLALFAGGIARSCAAYLKVGGLLLTNNHQGDAEDALQDQRFKRTAQIRFQKQGYVISQEGNDPALPKPRLHPHYLKLGNQGMAYVENETYYLFGRLH